MKRLLYSLALAALLLGAFVAAAFAQGDIPEGAIGACPTGFHFMEASHLDMDHDGMDHLHAGIQVDLNGDGWICVKHVTPTGKVHVHADNFLPLP